MNTSCIVRRALVCRSTVLALSVTALPALASEPRECTLARQLAASGKQRAAAQMHRVCAARLRTMKVPSPKWSRQGVPTNLQNDRKSSVGMAAGANAPRPAPPPTAQPAVRSPATATPENWASGLPTAAQVQASIRGKDAADTTLRQQAAFNVLRQLIRELSGFGKWSSVATSRFQEYDRVSPNRPTLGPANPYELNLDFQRDLLSRLVSAPTARAYESSSWFRKLEGLSRPKSDASARPLVEAPAWVQSDVKKAQDANIDLSIFGLQLGQALNLPECKNDLTGMVRTVMDQLKSGGRRVAKGDSQTCAGNLMAESMNQSGLFASLSGVGALNGDEMGVPDGKQIGIGIAGEKCPPWLYGCALSAMVSGGVMVGAAIPVVQDAASLSKVPAELQRKYGPADLTRTTRCTYETHGTAMVAGEMATVPTGTRTVEGKVLTWTKLPGAYVTFVPYHGNGCMSRVYVELATVHASATAANARIEAAQPKM